VTPILWFPVPANYVAARMGLFRRNRDEQAQHFEKSATCCEVPRHSRPVVSARAVAGLHARLPAGERSLHVLELTAAKRRR
jgi:hypothetical protein